MIATTQQLDDVSVSHELLPKDHRDPQELSKDELWLITNRTIQLAGDYCPRRALDGFNFSHANVTKDQLVPCIIMDIIFELQYLLSIYAGKGMLLARPILFPSTSLIPYSSPTLNALHTTIQGEFGDICTFFKEIATLKANHPVYLHKDPAIRNLHLDRIVAILLDHKVGIKLLKCLLSLVEYKLHPLKNFQEHISEILTIDEGWSTLLW